VFLWIGATLTRLSNLAANKKLLDAKKSPRLITSDRVALLIGNLISTEQTVSTRRNCLVLDLDAAYSDSSIGSPEQADQSQELTYVDIDTFLATFY